LHYISIYVEAKNSQLVSSRFGKLLINAVKVVKSFQTFKMCGEKEKKVGFHKPFQAVSECGLTSKKLVFD